MQEIVESLKKKNEILEKFLGLNNDQLIKINKGNYENFSYFYSMREGFLNSIKTLDKQISQLSMSTEIMISEFTQSSVRAELAKKERIVKLIVNKDLEILSLISELKLNVGPLQDHERESA